MKALTISLALFSIGCIIALAWVLGTPAPTDPRVARLEADLKEARQTIAQLRRDLAAKPVATPPPVSSGAVGNTSLMIQTSTPPTGTPGAMSALPTGSGGANASALRDMLKNPAMKAMMEQQQAMQVETSYARLFDQLQLTDEEKSHFKKLLVERQKAETDLGLKLLDPNLKPEERQKIMAQAEQNKTTFDNAIKTFLNDENDWGSFQGWEDSKPERTSYDTVGRSLFAASSEPLSPQQEQTLLNTMTQVRKNPSPDQAALNKAMQDPTQMNDVNIQRLIQMTQQNNQRILDQSRQVLTPGQLKTLENYLQQSLNMTETGLKMGSMFLQGKK